MLLSFYKTRPESGLLGASPNEVVLEGNSPHEKPFLLSSCFVLWKMLLVTVFQLVTSYLLFGNAMSEEKKHNQPIDDSRREFLRKSVYAAYATPVITALLVSQVSASASSNNPNCLDPAFREKNPNVCVPRP